MLNTTQMARPKDAVAAIRAAAKRQVPALVVTADANDAVSFRETAFLVAGSRLVQVLCLQFTAPLQLYIPPRHESMILKIYRNLGKTVVPETVFPQSLAPPAGSAQVRSNLDEGEGISGYRPGLPGPGPLQ